MCKRRVRMFIVMMLVVLFSGCKSATSTTTSFFLEKSAQEFGAGTFQAGLGDLDGDGDLDAVFANPQRHNSEVWLNDGSGTLVDTGQQLTQYGHGVGVADFDGDGDLDAFIACHQFVAPSRIYLNDGTGLFQDTGQDLGDGSISGAELNLVDLNGDGNVDVHVMYYDPNGLPDKVYLNDGAGVFSDSGLALDEEIIAWGDLDADGDVDYLGKRYGEGYVVWLNDGSGRFSEGWQMEDARAMDGGIALGDFDGDGDLDALVANGFRTGGSYPTILLWNDGSGQFSDSGFQFNATKGAKFAVGDLDGDGALDVFVSNFDQPNQVWINDGNGYFTDSDLRLGTDGDASTKPSLGDLDGDGDLDVFVGSLMGKPEIWFNSALTTPSPSPPSSDSNKGVIAFYSERDGNAEIYTVNPDGVEQGSHNLRRLTDNSVGDMAPAMSPDGTRIAFRSGSDIYVMSIDGTDQQRLTNTPAYESHPDWSPDGTQIAFISDRDGNREVYVMDADGSNPQRLTDNPAEELRPDWSPDGTKILFNSDRDGNFEIYVVDVDGSNLRRLTNSPKWEMFPQWSPDGTQIAYTLLTPRQWDQEIYVMGVDGTNARQLTNLPAASEDPVWSPDGTQIVFQTDRDGNFEIYVMNADGSDQRRLTDDEAGDYWPTWGPGG